MLHGWRAAVCARGGGDGVCFVRAQLSVKCSQADDHDNDNGLTTALTSDQAAAIHKRNVMYMQSYIQRY